MHLRSVSSRKPKQPESDLPAPRKELVARLGDCLEQLQKLIATPYVGASSLDCWPTVDELNRLATAIGQLGKAIKITKVDFEHLDGVMRHLDRRYPKLGLLAFFDGLVRKLESIPVGPVTRINQRLAPGVVPNNKKPLLAIRDLLTSLEWKVEAKAGTWKELEPLLFEPSGVAGLRSRLRSAVNNLDKGIRWKPRAYRGTTLTRRAAKYNGNRIRAHMIIHGIQWQISVMPNIVSDQQGGDTGRQRANNIPVNAAKVNGIVQFSTDFFKSLSFPFQSVLGLIPLGSGTL